MTTVEARRLDEDARRLKNWKRWGPYLSERQWATVREDYSPEGRLWESFPYEHSLARAYRWGEDGKASPDDILIRLTVANRGPRPCAAVPVADVVVSQHVVL